MFRERMVTQDLGSEIPHHDVVDRNLECGGGDDNAIRRIRELIQIYNNFSDTQKGEEDINKNPDYHAKPGAEHVDEILRLIAGLDKSLKNAESIVLELKRGNIMPLDSLLNPREVQGPTEL